MKLYYTDLLFILSDAIDAVEKQVTGATSQHGKRVAYYCERMTKQMHLTDEQKSDLAGCAILHDNALAESLREDAVFAQIYNGDPVDDKTFETIQPTHVVYSEQNASILPWHTDVHNAILWHHENADGTGPFHLTEDQTNLYSELIHLGDYIDIRFNFLTMDQKGFDEMQEFVAEQAGGLFSHRSAKLLKEELSFADVQKLQRDGVIKCLKENIPVITGEYGDDEIRNIAMFFSGIVDYKSSFTKDHSMGVANKSMIMAKHYHWDDNKCIRYYFAGALHDIGKLIVPNTILQKPAKLTPEEFNKMKDHAAASYEMLGRIPEFEDIAEWAGNHHEKLDGSGYSRGLKAEQLSFEDRLMACLDIYQALTEERPYKKKFSYSQSIDIMRSMAESGKIDAEIVEDIATAFALDAEKDKKESSEEEASEIKEFRCDVCGFVFKGKEAPEHCPICDSPKEIAYRNQ
jgi:HD-GYP domain-containing protein (c-di-GMP phosphodiesterase class II)